MLGVKEIVGGVLGIAAGFGLVWLAFKGHGSSNMQERIAGALAAKDRAKLEALAHELERHGNKAAAAVLLEEAGKLGGGGTALKSAGSLLKHAMADKPEDPGRQRAQNLTEHLKTHSRGHEDHELERAFQSAEKLNPDGRYGPGTATRILVRYGLMPVAPYYWSAGKTGKDQKLKFLQGVAAASTGDPERSEQYRQLAQDAARS